VDRNSTRPNSFPIYLFRRTREWRQRAVVPNQRKPEKRRARNIGRVASGILTRTVRRHMNRTKKPIEASPQRRYPDKSAFRMSADFIGLYYNRREHNLHPQAKDGLSNRVKHLI